MSAYNKLECVIARIQERVRTRRERNYFVYGIHKVNGQLYRLRYL